MHNRKGRNVIQENTGSVYSSGKWSLLTIFIVAAAILTALLPAFRSGVYVHGDLGFHLGRIESLYEGLRAGVFPLKVHFTLANGYGYGEGFFYPDALLYYPALLRFTGLSLECCYKVYVVTVILLTWSIMYASLKRLLDKSSRSFRHRGGSTLLSVCGASIYILSFRFMHSIYEYGSVGTYTAMAFMPMAISGLLMIMYAKYQLRDQIWMTAGVALTVLSHSTSAIVTIVFMVILFLPGIRRLTLRKLRDLVACAVCGMLATIGYWLPALEQVGDQSFYLNSHPAFLLTDNILGLLDVFRFSGPAEVCAVVLLIALCIVNVVQWCRRRSYRQNISWRPAGTGGDQLAETETREDRKGMLTAVSVTSLLFAAAVYCAPLWNLIGGQIQFLQSPTRLLGTASAGVVIALCLGGDLICSESAAGRENNLLHNTCRRDTGSLHGTGKKTGKWCNRCPKLLMFGLTLLFTFQTARQVSSYTDTVPADSLDYYGGLGLGAGTEWLPDGGSQYAIDETERAIDSEGEGAYGVKYEGGKYFDVYIRLDREYYDMPYFYYKGYAAYLVDDSGNVIQQLPVEKAPAERHAYVRVLLPENGEGIGHVIVTYRKTAIQKAAYVVNAIFIGMLVAIAGVQRRRRKRKENQHGHGLYHEASEEC